MKKIFLNKTATKTFLKLIENLNDDNRSRKIDTSDGAFIPVSVEFLYRAPDNFSVYSLTHYTEQNGDLMKDPDVEFFVNTKHDLIIPATFENSFIGVYRVNAKIENGKFYHNRRATLDNVSFCNLWLKNIKAQQAEYFKN